MCRKFNSVLFRLQYHFWELNIDRDTSLHFGTKYAILRSADNRDNFRMNPPTALKILPMWPCVVVCLPDPNLSQAWQVHCPPWPPILLQSDHKLRTPGIRNPWGIFSSTPLCTSISLFTCSLQCSGTGHGLCTECIFIGGPPVQGIVWRFHRLKARPTSHSAWKTMLPIPPCSPSSSQWGSFLEDLQIPSLGTGMAGHYLGHTHRLVDILLPSTASCCHALWYRCTCRLCERCYEEENLKNAIQWCDT